MNPELVQIEHLKFKRLYSEKHILEQIDRVAKEVNAVYEKIQHEDPKAKIVLIGVLNGAFMFATELIKRLTVPIYIDFVKVSSYSGMTNGDISIDTKIKESLFEGAHVLLVDDICDTGNTLHLLVKKLKTLKIKSIQTAVLVVRPDKEHKIKPDFVGLTCEHFIIGFGLDYNESGRQYTAIY